MIIQNEYGSFTVEQFEWTTQDEYRHRVEAFQPGCPNPDPENLVTPGRYRVVDGDLFRIVPKEGMSIQELSNSRGDMD